MFPVLKIRVSGAALLALAGLTVAAPAAHADATGARLGACLNADLSGSDWTCGTLSGWQNLLASGTGPVQEQEAKPVSVLAGGAVWRNDDTENSRYALDVDGGTLTLRRDWYASSMVSVPIKFTLLNFLANNLRLTGVSAVSATGAWRQNGAVEVSDDQMTVYLGGHDIRAGMVSAGSTGAPNPNATIVMSADNYPWGGDPWGSDVMPNYAQLTLNFTTAPLQAQASAVPEPGSLALVALALAGAGAIRRRTVA